MFDEGLNRLTTMRSLEKNPLKPSAIKEQHILLIHQHPFAPSYQPSNPFTQPITMLHFSRRSSRIVRQLLPQVTHNCRPARFSSASKLTQEKPSGDQPGSYIRDMWANASRPTKILLLTGLIIAGTAETVFWVKLGWTKFTGRSEISDEE